ncbi:hypothetical protein Q0812_00155 [Brevundimonas sp. 2R-24]|uniref:Uncharacterized protein n=1 Tax=Peiella sedimenti TaxID=3061083 RepID=A0ABT8SGZ9_9CAUL|nr:hypothetical protein [Caulobacteraceae bacterium XZ-24]
MTSNISRRTLVAGIAIAAAGPALAQDAPRTVAVRRVFPYLDRYLGLPANQRDRFTLAYYVTRNDQPARGLTGYILLNGARTPITVGQDGRAPMPSLAQWRDGQIGFDVPPGTSLGVNMEMQPNVPASQAISAPALAAALEQAAVAMRRAAGVLGFAAPRLDAVILRGAGSARVEGGAGGALPLRGGHPYFKPSDYPGAALIRASRRPERLTFGSVR